MSLRPILKRASNLDPPHHRNHAVHFPPHTSLTHTFTAHSSSTYDRSPIVVTPNHCALPERGCPGRTYGLDDSPVPPTRTSINHPQYYTQNGRAYHPRALALGSLIHHDDHVSDNFRCDDRQITPVSLPPPLVPDTSSESDESDGSSFTPPNAPYPNAFSGYPISDTGLSINSNTSDTFSYLSYSSCKSSNVLNASSNPSALSFLPHPPSPPRQHFYTSSEDEIVRKPRRSRSRRRDRSRDRDRIRESDDDYYYYDDEIDPLPFQPPPPRLKPFSPSRKDSMYKPLSLSKTMTSLSFQDQDSGCLGGF
jgi:hypothetical protein